MNTREPAEMQLQVGGRLHSGDALGLSDSIGAAYSKRERPRCMCTQAGAEMYIARLGDNYLVKRMPGSGSEHAPSCPSYEPAAEFSGLVQVLGTAIVEDPETGLTQLRLDFPMSKGPNRQALGLAKSPASSARSSGTRLSLRGLLHYLWEQAELNSWSSDIKERRTWPFIRKSLVQAMAGKFICGRPISQQLYIPEPFFLERREAIRARQANCWQLALSGPLGRAAMILTIGELKELGPTRFGYRALIKHMPDVPLILDEQLFRKTSNCFRDELLLWGASDTFRAILIATMAIGTNGVAQLNEVSLMLVNRAWIPVANAFEHQLLDLLMHEERSFCKPLAYNLAHSAKLPSALLKDAGIDLIPLHINLPGESIPDLAPQLPSAPDWPWDPGQNPSVPRLPSVAP